MNVIPTEVLDVYILEPKVFGDHRGWFMETSPIPPKKERCEASIFKRVTLPRQSWCAAAAVRYWM